ncbi:hypothetical protein [Promicromonospora sp. NPDC023987]|uniref:hypothetical protein n=1 Tax=Promicromonospora sp. NPDC023987 TaxID=3155360 RepID=UPI003409902E
MARADGIALLESEVRELVRRRGVDPMAEPDRLTDLVREAAADYADRAARGLLLGLPDMERVVREVSDAVGGFGPLQPYLDDPEIEEVWLNAPSRAANLLPQPGCPDPHHFAQRRSGGAVSARLIAVRGPPRSEGGRQRTS